MNYETHENFVTHENFETMTPNQLFLIVYEYETTIKTIHYSPRCLSNYLKHRHKMTPMNFWPLPICPMLNNWNTFIILSIQWNKPMNMNL
jgi:hypothetical protein